MAMIEKRRLASGKTTYRARVKYRGRTMTSTHYSRLSAERWSAEAAITIRNDAHFIGESNRLRPLKELIERYEAHVLTGKSNPKNQKLHLAWWKERLGMVAIKDVTRSVIAQCRDELLAPASRGKSRGPATTVRYLASLSHVFSVAISDWEWATDNPVKGVQKPKEPAGRVRYLSDVERERLLAACKSSSSPDLYLVVTLALTTGMRRGEIMSLTWDNIDLQRAVVNLHQTKNGTHRTIPITAHAREMLAKRNTVRRIDTNLVFPSDIRSYGSKKVISPRDITKPWETARRKAGLVDFRFHDLRHSAASYLAMSGASTLDIATLLGHKQLQMTKRYAHLSVDHLRTVVERAVGGTQNA